MSLNYWDSNTNKVKIYREIEGKRLFDGLNYIFIDSQNRLWMSSYAYSAYFKQPGKAIKKIPFSQDEPYSIAYGHFTDVFEDSDRNLWFATINGLSKNVFHNPFLSIFKLPSFKFVLETELAQALAIKIEKNTIIAAKDDGIVFYNIIDQKFKRLVVSQKKDLHKNMFNSLTKVGENWWFTGMDGIYELKKGRNKLSKFNKLSKNNAPAAANFVFEDRKGKIWFHIYNDGIYRYDPLLKTYKKFDGTESKYGLFHYKECQTFLQLNDGNLLFAMEGTGLLKFDLELEIFSIIPICNLPKFFMTKMVEDHLGNIWAAVLRRGILKIDKQGNCIDSLNTGNGLPFDDIACLAIDSRGAIWASGQEGLIFFFPKNKEIRKVKIDLGKTMQDFWSYITIVDNKVYAVMLDHVVVIDPFRFTNIKVKKAPHITSVRIFSKNIPDFQKDSPLELAPEQNIITFQYASLNHRDIPSLQYSYQLEGIDKNWISNGRSVAVSYNNLAPGFYTFKVRSTDENGNWMSTISRLRIHVRPPWWQTWWFITILAVIAGILIHLVNMNFSARKKKAAFDKAIDYFANSFYGENSVSEVCWDITRNCVSQLRFEECAVYLWDDGKKKLVLKALYGTLETREYDIIEPIEIRIGEGTIGAAAEAKKTVIISDTSKGKRSVCAENTQLSEIAVPIMHDGEVIGIVNSGHSRKNFFDPERARALFTIASISANKIAEAQAQEEAQQKEIMLLEINKMLAESQLMALRAQMNPHFVFNCLNSIQECIVTHKYEEASRYLNKFSKLFRMVLNNSDKDLVTIEEEVEVLQLYLELEQMRFESFTYQINVDEDLEDEEITLPSMLLQPYVENAIWHGLMHKKDNRNLTIVFERISDDIFRCVIEDNGIGRKRSFEIKEHNSKGKRHKSKGLQIAKDRLELLQRRGQHASVDIIDKYDPEGTATGTLVLVELSTFLNNL